VPWPTGPSANGEEHKDAISQERPRLGVDAEIARDHWQTLEVAAEDNGFTIWLADQWVLTAFDYSKLVSGQFGIWTERDDVTRFNQIEISPLTSDYERSDLRGQSGG